MELWQIISLVSVIVWLGPTFKQWRTDYKYYFLVLAIFDPLRLASYYIFNTYAVFLVLPFTFLQLISLFITSKIPAKKWILFSLIILLSVFVKDQTIILAITFVCQILIFLIFFLKFADSLVNNNQLNLFLMMLIAYVSSTILKYIPPLTDINTGAYYFHITSIFQILFGIFFSLVNEWKIKMKADLEEYKSQVKRDG